MSDYQPGDLIVRRKGRLQGVDHVSLIVSVFGAPVLYESTMEDRTRCVRTGRDEPKGVQAHYVDDAVNAGGAFHMSLIRPLYVDEVDRLLEVAESCLGRGYEFIGGTTSSAFVARVLAEVGVIQHKNARHFSPRKLVSYLVRRGIYSNPTVIV